MKQTQWIQACTVSCLLAALMLPARSAGQTAPAQTVPPPTEPKASLKDPAVTQPQVLYAPQPGFSDEARRAGIGGVVLVKLTIEADGTPSHVAVLRGVGYGLDEKAVEAIKKYRFRPAMKNGVAIPVEINISVRFQIKN